MNAVEFQTTVHDGIINLPIKQQAWNGKKIRVILLETVEDKPQVEISELAVFRQFKGKYQGGFNREECHER